MGYQFVYQFHDSHILTTIYCEYIKDIYFLEVNTKYISSSVLKTSEVSRVRSTRENSDVFNSRDKICLVFTEKSKFSFYFILLIGYLQYLTHCKTITENAKRTFLANPNNFDTKICVTFKLRKCVPTLDVFVHK